MSVIVKDWVTDGSLASVAVTTTVGFAGIVTGAEYTPELLIVPAPVRLQVTAVLLELTTLAAKLVLRPRQAVVGFTPCPLSAVSLIVGDVLAKPGLQRSSDAMTQKKSRDLFRARRWGMHMFMNELFPRPSRPHFKLEAELQHSYRAAERERVSLFF
jgi:hypothetical protein